MCGREYDVKVYSVNFFQDKFTSWDVLLSLYNVCSNISKRGLWQVNYCFPSCFTLNSEASRAGLIICVNKRDASLLSSILKFCPSLLPTLSPCWLYLTVSPSHRQRWQSVSALLPESHPSPTDGPDHSRSRYETREEIRHNSSLYLGLIFQLLDRRVCGIS